MRKAKKLAYIIPAFWSYRLSGKPVLFPINYTFSLTTRCNSRCKTCKIWANQLSEEMSLEEWDKVFSSLGDEPMWITLSGGEIFLIEGVSEIVRSIAKHNNPLLLVIPTNGLLVDRIISELDKILSDPTVRSGIGKITVNVSLDGVGSLHDEIRGIPGNFDRVVDLVKRLRLMKSESRGKLSVGVHTVLSKWNIKYAKDISDFVWDTLSPDQHIFEIAEVRREMYNSEESPTPSWDQYKKFLEFWYNDSKIASARKGLKGVNRIRDIFRSRYYRYLEDVVYKRTGYLVPSYAGFASVHINANGEVWNCAVFCDVMGNLRDYGFDFKRLWTESPLVREVQRAVKKEHRCPLANENYINFLLSPWELIG